MLTMNTLLETLTSASIDEIESVRRVLRITPPLVRPMETPVPPSHPSLPHSVPKPPASVVSSSSTSKFEFPVHTEGEPSAEDYRVPEEKIDYSVCIAREVGNQDSRWSIAVFTERQCGRPLVEGSDLCKRCLERCIKYETKPGPGNWTGRINQAPLDWQHMLGTEWAEKQIRAGKLTFYPTVKAEETKSTASGTSKESVAKRLSDSQAVLAELNAKKAAALAEKEAKKEAEKARKEAEKAEKEAKKEAEKAEKEAKKEAEKAEKEAKKEAEKARKEAEKAEEKARKEALKKTAPTAPKSVKPPPPPPPAVAVESVGEIIQMDDVMYWISNGNVYAYDCGDEKIQEYLGRLTGNGDDIPYGIQDGDEVTVAESVTA